MKSNFIEIYDNALRSDICDYLIDTFEYCSTIELVQPGAVTGTSNKSNMVKDSVVIQTMRYMELLKELKKSGNKNKKTL